MRRPLLPVALLFAGGILTASLVTIHAWLLLALSAAAGLFAVLLERARAPLLVVGIVLAGGANYTLRTAPLSPNDFRKVVGNDPILATVRGTLLETPSLRVYEMDEKPSWRTLCRLKATALRPERKDWQPVFGTIAVTTPGMLTNLAAGQVVEVTGVLERPRTAAAEGLFDYRRYLAEQGIYYRLRAASERDWAMIDGAGGPGLADRFREWARKELGRGLPEEDEALRLEWALTLGWKTALTEEVSEPFIRAATYHIFAVDGLRMAILFGIFFSLFRAIGLPRAVGGAILVPLIWFYVALTGWPASAIRATVMLTVIIVGWMLRRPSDLLNSLFAAALIILVWEPRQLFQAGFQLSFLVVLCIILLLPPLRQAWERLWRPDPLVPPQLRSRWRSWLRPPGRYLGELLLTSFAAWVGSVPLVAYYFNLVTPVSTPANIVAVPLCALALMSNLGALICAAWFPWATVLLNHAGWFLMELILVTSQWFASWPKAYFYCQAPSLWTATVYYALLLALGTGWAFRSKWRRLRLVGIALLAGCWAVSWWPGRAVSKVTVLGTAGGYAMFCDLPGSKEDLLVDCGNSNGVQLITKPFLHAAGINHLPRLVLSHGDLRQMGGARLVNELFGPVQVFTGPLSFRSPVYRRTLQWFETNANPVFTVGRSNRIAGWTVLHPDAEDRFTVADDKALVLAREVNGVRILFLSDLGRPGQEKLLERNSNLRADIVITGLPVRPEALCDGLLEAVRPRLIIVCDSEFPAQARAPPALRDRLSKWRVRTLYLRSAEAVTLEFNGRKLEIRTRSGERFEKLDEPGPVVRSRDDDGSD